jgi:hypothetical protein
MSGDGDGKLLGLADFDDALYCFLDVSQCLFARFSLRYTAGEGRTLGYDIAIVSRG